MEECSLFLASISGQTSITNSQFSGEPDEALCDWIIEFGLGALANKRFKGQWPELAQRLQADTFSAFAENSIQFECMNEVVGALMLEGIAPAILKGAAIAEHGWGDIGLRPMSDIDLWVMSDNVELATNVIERLGYKQMRKDNRPIALQRLVEGEIEFLHPKWRHGMIDLHWAPFHGWWYRHATRIDNHELWENREALVSSGHSVWRLSAEDMIIHLALHLAINAHFSPHTAIRSMLDIVFSTKAWPVDWKKVVERARRWHVATALWVVLDLTRQLVGFEDAAYLLEELQPSRFRRAIIKQIVSPKSIMEGREWGWSRLRFLILACLTDKTGDLARCALRAIWPDQKWLFARYGQSASRRRHFLQLLKSPAG